MNKPVKPGDASAEALAAKKRSSETNRKTMEEMTADVMARYPRVMAKLAE